MNQVISILCGKLMIVHWCEEGKCSFQDVSHLQYEPLHSMSCHWKEHPSARNKLNTYSLVKCCNRFTSWWLINLLIWKQLDDWMVCTTWDLWRSSLRRSKTLVWEYGSQVVETALRITPLGWPGSVIFLVVILTVSSGLSDIAVHDWPPQVLMLRLNVFIILWASFIKFFRASGEGITAI